jgi:hypothetical protein
MPYVRNTRLASRANENILTVFSERNSQVKPLYVFKVAAESQQETKVQQETLRYEGLVTRESDDIHNGRRYPQWRLTVLAKDSCIKSEWQMYNLDSYINVTSRDVYFFP